MNVQRATCNVQRIAPRRGLAGAWPAGRRRAWLLAAALGLVGCGRAAQAPPLFEQLSPQRTGVTFVNQLPSDTAFNILTYPYYYDGGGVAVGDVNNDGLPDLYFTANAGANHLYLNKGNYRFEDITAQAGVADSVGWKTGVTMADVNGDGLDDIYLGGAKNQPGALLIQRPDGHFSVQDSSVFARDRISEDLGAVFCDADGDGHPALYVVSGGNEFSSVAPALQDRLYLNDGRGHFHKATGRLPTEYDSGSRVVAADYDGDGDMDLFVGGRVVPWRYGDDPRSMLLQNDGHGHFTDVTQRLAPELQHVGMVTDAVWRDVDGDGRLDLVVVGEWMPITIFHNAGGGRLVRMQTPGLERSEGWWNRIVAGDFTGDGKVDFLVGNLGLNTRLQASDSQPVMMYVKDFDGNGFAEQIVTSYHDGKSYPLIRLEISSAYSAQFGHPFRIIPATCSGDCGRGIGAKRRWDFSFSLAFH